MILKDLMEEKQLNLNQPLLSVRRFSSTVASETDHKSKTDKSLGRLLSSPAYNSELKSCPVRNAGTIPFVWEKAPGRPKDENKLQTQADEQRSISTSNSPPGRVSQIKQQSVPEMRTESNLSSSQSVASLDKKAPKYSKGKTKEKEGSYSDDGDDAYEEALYSLSRTESFFMSCRESGLSGWDEQEVQPIGSFSSDHQQARDFMIDRFLLAAKAVMTSEAPQYASKKALVGKKQQKQKKKDVNSESSRPLNQHMPKPLPHYSQDIDKEDCEDERDDCNEYGNYTTTTCGLFPRFCLLNPINGLKMGDKVQRNAAHRMPAKSSASHIESKKEQVKTPYGFTEKEILDILVKSKHGTDPRQRGCRKLASSESTQRDPCYGIPAVEKTLHVDSAQKVKSQTNNIGGDFETLRRNGGIYDNHSVDSSRKTCNRISSESQVNIRGKNSNILTQNSEVDWKSQLAARWVDQECTLASSKARYDTKIDLERQHPTKLGHQEISSVSCFGLPLALPSLKGPSESWLKRTLPTISKRNMTSQSNLTANISTRSKIPKRNATAS